jgi:hypothetical protein
MLAMEDATTLLKVRIERLSSITYTKSEVFFGTGELSPSQVRLQTALSEVVSTCTFLPLSPKAKKIKNKKADMKFFTNIKLKGDYVCLAEDHSTEMMRYSFITATGRFSRQ